MASYPTNLPWAGPHGLTARYTAGGAAASSSSAPGGAPPDGSLAELLDDFSSLLDAEWRVIIAAMLSMLAMVYAIVARLIVRRRRPPATLAHTRADPHAHRAPQIYLSPGVVHWGWRYSFWGCLLLFVACLVYIIEPRPAFLFRTFGQIEHRVWTRSLSEYKSDLRRWWRWRKKYAVNTKLNV